MKQLLLAILFCVVINLDTHAQAQATIAQYMQITTIESTVSGGGGRSKLIITFEDGRQQETDMLNLFSLLGINFKNIQSNDLQIVKALTEFAKQGWRLVATIPLVPVSEDNSLCMTRYLLMREK
jgi:hypothetical protein